MTKSKMRTGSLQIPPGIRYMAAGAFFFSIMALLVKFAGQRLPSQELVLARAVVSLALSHWAIRRANISLRTSNAGLLALRGFMGFLALSCFYYAVVHLPLADANVLQYTNPVWAALLAVKLLEERLGGREIGAVALSLAGVLLVARPTFLFGGAPALNPVAVAIGLGGAMCSGTAYVLIRMLRDLEHPLVIVYYFALVAVICSIPTALPQWVWPTAWEWLVLLGIGVTTQLGQVAFTHGLHLERAGIATAVGYLQIVFAAIWGGLFFAEWPDWFTVGGALLIIGSTLALARRRDPAVEEEAAV